MDPRLIVMLILAGAVLLFLSNRVSAAVTALLVSTALYVTGVIDAGEMVAGFSNSAVILTMGMLIISGAMLSCGFADILGGFVLKFVKGERNVMTALVVLGIFLSAFMSAIGTVSVLIPLCIGVCQREPGNYRLGKLAMPCSIACSTGGMLTLIGKPPNITANQILIENGYGSMGFFELAKVGLPIAVIFILFMHFWGYKLIPDTGIDPFSFSITSRGTEIKKWKKAVCIVIFLGTVISLAMENVTGIPSHVSAFAGAAAVLAANIVSDREAFKRIEWRSIFLIAGMLPLARAMVSTKAADSIAGFIIDLLGEHPSPVILTGVLFLIVTVLTEFMSNVAACTLFAPIGLAVAQGLSINPVSVVLAIAIASGCSFATPVGNPVSTYVMGYGGYRFRDYMKVGLWLNLISWLIGVAMISVFWPYY